MYDVIIVGSGLGGMLSAYILSKEGYNVCVIEKNKQLGGSLQTFVRNNCIFDTGMHYVGSLGEGQILNQFFKYFDLMKKVKIKKLDEKAFDIINIAGQEFNYSQGFENFAGTLSEYFPQEKDSIYNYTNKIKTIGYSLYDYVRNEQNPDQSGIVNFEYFYVNTHKYLESVTADKKLQNVLAGLNGLYAGLPESNPLYIHALINFTLIESSWRFVDGGDQIIKFLAESVKSMGGTILKSTEVSRFLVNSSNDKLKSVQLNTGDEIEAKHFISNIHPSRTFEMVQTDMIRKVYRNRIDSIENSISVFSLYIVLKENSFKYLNYNYYKYNNTNVWGVGTYDKSKWPDGYMFFTPATSKSDIYADSITAITYMKYDELLKWENSTVEKRGDEYLAFKKEKAELLINEIEKDFPEIRKCIKTYYTSTPLTYRDYTGTKKGAIYGILKDSNDPLKSFITPKTRIPNLYLTGQNINLHGILGVSIGSLLTCAEFFGLKYLFKKVTDAQ